MSFIFKKSVQEEVILTIQDHWFVLLKPILLLVSNAIIFPILLYAAYLLKPINAYVGMFVLTVGIAFLMLCLHFFFILLLQWEISTLVITTKRIIDLRFLPYAEDDVVHVEIDRINEIEKIKHGFWRNLLNYGTISVIIPGKIGLLEFKDLSHPGKITDFIEALKFQRPLNKEDFIGMHADFAKKYQFLDPRKP